MKLNIKKGFTLVELLVVIAIIAILAAVVAPNAFKAIEKAKVDKVILDCKGIKAAVLAYHSDTGTWPTITRGESINKEDLFVNPGIGGWDGPYLERWPNNPFNRYDYSLDYYDVNGSNQKDGTVDNGHLKDKDVFVIEISFADIPDRMNLIKKLHNIVDNDQIPLNSVGTRIFSGDVRSSGNAYAYWVIAEKPSSIKTK